MDIKRNPFGKNLVLMTMGLVLVGTACSKSEIGSTSQSTAPTQGASSAPSASANKLKLKTWILADTNFRGKDYNEKASFQEMTKRTNVEIEWVTGNAADGPSSFNLLMASGQLPDMVFYGSMATEGPKYGQQGAFVDLAPYIDKYAPNFKKIMAEYPDVKRMISTADGKIYYFPQLNLDQYLHVQMFPQIRQDWLDKLSLKQPVTTDDWYNVLKAFKEKDPNANGKADEIPFVSVNLANMVKTFGPAFGVDWEFYIDNGKVKFAPYEQGFKDTLQFLNKLYSEGLIDSNYLVDTDFKFLTEKVTTDRAGAWAGWSGSYMTSFTNLMKGHPTFRIEGTEPPKGPSGKQRFAYHGFPVGTNGMAVASQSKSITEAVKWLDYQYSQEGIMLNNFGVEGVSYDMVNGYPKFKDVVLNNPNGLSSTEALLSFTIGGGSWPTVGDVRYQEQYDTDQAKVAKQKVAKFIDYKAAYPPIAFSAKQNDVVVPLLNDIRTFRDEYANAFVMGKRSFNDYDAFVQQLKKMNIDKVLEVYQQAYDEYMKRSN